MEALPSPVWIAHDPECRRITGNSASYRLLRMNPGSNISKSAPEEEMEAEYEVAVNGRILAPEELSLQRAAAMGEPVLDIEEEVIFSDGERRYVYGNAAPLFDEQGRVQGAVAAFVEITELKQAEHEIRMLNDTLEQRVAERTAELEASTHALESFCYSISHDLRAPLRSIDGFNQALSEEYQDQLDETAHDYIQRARGAAQRMERSSTIF